MEDNCKELIPEYLTLLKGVIDCPELPLNVSRSALQRDAKVQKIAQHITKKVADKLTGMFKVERDQYQKFWDDINPFVKYAMMRDTTFFERMKDCVVYKTCCDNYYTMDEYLDKYKDQTDNKIIYANDTTVQAGYLKMLKGAGLEALIANRVLDQHFLPYLEMQSSNKYTFQRVDADVVKHLTEEDTTSEIVDPKDNKTLSQKLEDLFKEQLNNDKLKIRVESFKGSQIPAILLVDENMRRLKEMARTGHLGAFQPDLTDSNTLVINKNSDAVKNLLELAQSFNRDEEVKLIAQQIYDLAALQQGGFQPESMEAFIDRSTTILSRLGRVSTAET